MARMSSGSVSMLVEVALLKYDVFAHDEPVRGHFFQRRQNPRHVLVSIHKGDDDRQLASGFDHVRGLHAMASEKSGNRMHRGCGVDIFLAQEIENLHM